MKKINLLIVEDEESLQMALSLKLQKFGRTFTASNSDEAKKIAIESKIDIAFIDLNLEKKLAGLELLNVFKDKNIYCIILSGTEDEDIITRAYENGCHDYYVKGKDLGSLDNIVEKFLLTLEDDSFENFLKDKFVTQDASTIEQISLLKEVRHNASPVLILGPTGTGKTIIAREIHSLSKCEGEFVEINCSAIPENLLESELFGHVKGSFTGAVNNKDGLLLKADKGIIFLDEIGALPLSLQAKLLKALEDKSFTPVGGLKAVHSDFRIVSATCEDIDEYRKTNQFRNDLYFRISGINITLKSLKDRPTDINYLMNHFLKDSSRKIVVTKEARDKINQYSWPGNIRELKKVVHLLLTKQKGIVSIEDLPGFLLETTEVKREGMLLTPEIKGMAKEIGLYETIELLKNEIMKSVSEDNNGKVNKTIQDLKISTNTYYKLTRNESNSSSTIQ